MKTAHSIAPQIKEPLRHLSALDFLILIKRKLLTPAIRLDIIWIESDAEIYL